LSDGALTQLRRERVGFIFQSFQLLHTLTVFENVELPLLLAGKHNPREVARQRLAWVELEGLGDRFPHQLSGGQMQRVAIARALIHSPSILLADEPTGNLDTTTGNVILELLRRLTRERNTATIMATHSPEAAALANTVVRLRDGKIEELIFQLKERFTIVIVTHNMQQASRVAEFTGFFLLGKLIEFDKTEKIFTNPTDKRTEDYITGRFG